LGFQSNDRFSEFTSIVISIPYYRYFRDTCNKLLHIIIVNILLMLFTKKNILALIVRLMFGVGQG